MSPMKPRKIHEKILSGSREVSFENLCKLARAFGFTLERLRGSHHIFRHPLGLKLNLQPGKNKEAKMYQVRQLLRLVEENGLRLGESDE